MNRLLIFFAFLTICACQESSKDAQLNLFLKGKIFGSDIYLSDKNSTVVTQEAWFDDQKIFISGFQKDKTAYFLSNTVPSDTLENSDLYSLLIPGMYRFETVGTVKNSELAFTFQITEETSGGYNFYGTKNSDNSGMMEIKGVELESDTTIIIYGNFTCDMYDYSNRKIIGKVENMEFRSRFSLE